MRSQLLPRAWEPALKSVVCPIFGAPKSRCNSCNAPVLVAVVRDRCCGQMSIAVSSIICSVPSFSVAPQVGLFRRLGGVGLRGGAIFRKKCFLRRDCCIKEGEIHEKKLQGVEGVVASMTSAVGSPPVGYRPNVGVCLVNDKDEVWVGSRLDLPDSWQMPQQENMTVGFGQTLTSKQGGVDEGEQPQEAAIRELREETGVISAELIGEVPDWLTYDFPPDVKAKITRLWGKPWTGQAQKWFLFRFTGDDSEVNLTGDGTEPAEFVQWKWMPAEYVIRMVVDFKKPVYTKAFKSLAVYVESWSRL